MDRVFNLPSNRKTLLGFLIVLCCGLYGLRQAFYAFLRSKATDLVAGDYTDSGLIVAGLKRTNGMSEVLHWWHGPWVAGPANAFYRPLTSTIWYLEYHVFGPDNYVAFQLVHFLSHLLTILIAWLFFSELLGRRIATVGICLFALSVPFFLLGFPAAQYALPNWKDDPEFWFSSASLLSLWSFLRYLRRQERKYIAYALLSFFLAVTIKEMSYIVPLLLALLLWHEKKLATHWKALLPFYILAAGLFAFRFWALGGMGFRFGSNGSWWQRWFINVIGGSAGAQLLTHNFMPLGLACAFIALYALRMRAWFAATISAVITVATFLWIRRDWGIQEEPFYYPLFGTIAPWVCAFLMLLLLGSFYRCVAVRRRSQFFAWLWVFVSYIPLTTAPITEHALYFVSLGWSFWFAYAIADLVRFLLHPALYRPVVDAQY